MNANVQGTVYSVPSYWDGQDTCTTPRFWQVDVAVALDDGQSVMATITRISTLCRTERAARRLCEEAADRFPRGTRVEVRENARLGRTITRI